MNKKTKKVIIESIDHHERMQTWVKTQPLNKFCSWAKMKIAIGEYWYDNDCSLCKLFGILAGGAGCVYCPLCIKFGKCGYPDVNNAWNGLAIAVTWKQWLKFDKKLVRQLKSLLELKDERY